MSIFKKLGFGSRGRKRDVPDDVEYIDDEDVVEIEEYEGGLEDDVRAEETEEVFAVAGFEDEVGDENEEEESENHLEDGEEGSGVRINFKRELLNTSRRDKEEVYENIRRNTSNDELRAIDRLLKESATTFELFRKVEGENISLMVLVALGFITEEDLVGYRAYEKNGLDTNTFLTEEEIVKPFDMDYAQEVFSSGVQFPLDVTVVEQEVDEDEQVVSDLDSEQEVSEDMVEVTDKIDDTVLDSDGQDNDSEELEALKRLSLLRLEKAVAEVGDVTPVEDRVGVSMENSGTFELGVVSPISEGEWEVEEESIVSEALKNVYVVGEGIEVPDIEGYVFHKVEAFENVRQYSTSKDNLLVVTSKIPGGLMKGFGEWLTGIMEDGDVQRMVTLRDAPVSHPNIEKVIELTKNELDDYYMEYTSDVYGQTESGSFLDFSKMYSET